jgi:hypothetical protein
MIKELNETNPVGDDENHIRQKRLETLAGAYELMVEKWGTPYQTKLHDPFVAATVEQYLRDRKALKLRDKIPCKIQRYKVAGLMASAIISNRPIQVLAPSHPQGLSNSFDNEYFAVIHGLAICAEGYEDKAIYRLFEDPHFAEWCEDFVALLRFTTPHSDSLVHIFRTLCLGYFPANLEKGAAAE